jgi:hypothetical protein
MTPIQKIKVYAITHNIKYYEIAKDLRIETNRFYALTREDRRPYPHEIDKIEKLTTNVIG